MKQVLRKEKKYLLDSVEVSRLCHRMDLLLHRDEHAGPNGYQVRSLYFDSIYDRDYFDKADSIEIRKKIRLRTYDPSSDFALLEMKQKQNDSQLKRSLKVKREDAIELTKGNYSSLLSYKEDFALECYSIMQSDLYKPKTIVEYNRIPYVVSENNIRITLDSRIEATESNYDLFDEKLNMNPVMDRTYTVLEVKYNGFLLSYIQQILNEVDKSEITVSKYVLARQQSMLTSLV